MSFTDDSDLSDLSAGSRASDKRLIIHVFRVSGFSGEPVETTEMRPRWFTVNEKDESNGLPPIPYDQMWPDDKYWLPLLLQGGYFELTLHFDRAHSLLSHQTRKLAGPAKAW